MTGQHGPAQSGRRGAARPAALDEADEEARIECVAGTGRVGRRQGPRRHVEGDRGAGRVEEMDRGAVAAALDDDDGESPSARAPRTARLGESSRASSSPAVARRTSGATARTSGEGRRPAPGEERPDRRQVEADRGARPAGQPDRLPTGGSERLAEERVERQVEQVRTP